MRPLHVTMQPLKNAENFDSLHKVGYYAASEYGNYAASE